VDITTIGIQTLKADTINIKSCDHNRKRQRESLGFQGGASDSKVKNLCPPASTPKSGGTIVVTHTT
jgi:hypothetical protein